MPPVYNVAQTGAPRVRPQEARLIILDVPGWRKLELHYLVLDVNGTLAVDGVLLPGVAARIAALAEVLEISIITADTHGKSAGIAQTLGVRFTRIQPGDEAGQKRAYVEQTGAARTVAIGNGANDAGMLGAAAVGIAVLGGEGLATAALQAAAVITATIDDALDLLLHPARLMATLRR